MPAAEATSDESSEPPSSPSPATPSYQAAWPWVLCVIGLDYLSTLAYQPSIAFGAAGRLAPLATVLVAAVTLLLALPVYWYIAGRSPHGGGSTALLERAIPGWFGKLLILVLLSFGAVDLVFTRTFSAADAAEHLIHNPNPAWQHALNKATLEGERIRLSLPSEVQTHTSELWNRQMVVTLIVLIISTVGGLAFFRGYTRNFVRLAVLTVLVYLALTLTIVGSAGMYLSGNPHLLENWWSDVWNGNWHETEAPRAVGGWGGLLAACVPLFPYLALGLSGFELTLMAMPLVRGKPNDDPAQPRGRIRRTRFLLVVAALTMTTYLLASTLMTTVLIPAKALTTNGQARYRALAYLAHGGTLSVGTPAADINPIFGLAFGTAYDISTVAILALAGLSFAMTLSKWIPPYLHRLGMEFNWSMRMGLLVYLFIAVKIGVTIYYGADLESHRAAYLTAVLAVFGFASVAAAVDVWKRRGERGRRKLFRTPPLFILAILVFAASGALIAYEHMLGALMASGFIAIVLTVSIVSRAWRSTEFRFDGFDFADKFSQHEWERVKATDFPVLVPIRPGLGDLKDKEIDVRLRYRIPGAVPIVFIQAELGDPSDFAHRPLIRIARENGRVVVYITRCASLAHAIAAAALEVSADGGVPEVLFGWSVENPVTANLHFVLFGHGNVPWMVHTLIQRAPVPAERKPRVIVG